MAAAWVALRTPSGLFLTPDTVERCALEATRFYVGWQELADATANFGPLSVTRMTRLESGEWSVIWPLFRLYCEREHAQVGEASRGLGVELVGRDAGTVGAEIAQYEAELPKKAFVEEGWSIGL